MPIEKENVKDFFRKFWFLLWKDNSLKGWFFSVIFLLLFIKLIFFPLLSLTTGTSLPLAIVESCSMYHKGNLLSDFDSWWLNHEEKYTELGINETDFREFSNEKKINKKKKLFIFIRKT